MTLQEFKSSLIQNKPPDNLSEPLRALWYDAYGDWDKAHKIAQEINDSNGSWIHAYLHRKEGDKSNAQYWYSHAGRKFSNLTIEEEWEEISEELLKKTFSKKWN
jgi:hypothetical protein